MPKYRVYFTSYETDYVDVVADDDESAINEATAEIGYEWEFDDIEEIEETDPS